MKKKITHRSDCPISMSLDIFGDKWSLLVIRDLMFDGKKTYGEFLDSEEKIATNILADRLLTLESGGVISKTKHPDSKAKILYKLTPKGIDLVPLMVEMILWSEKYHEVHPYAKQFAKQVKKNKQGSIKEIFEALNKT